MRSNRVGSKKVESNIGVGELGSIEFEARELGVVRWVQESQEQESWE